MFHIVKAWLRGIQFDNFYKGNYVAIFFDNIDYRELSIEQIKEKTHKFHPEMSPAQLGMTAGQIYRFMMISASDYVITYNPEKRLYHIGIAIWKLTHQPETDNQEWSMKQSIEWKISVSRDVLPIEIKNSLGAISTVFNISDEYGNHMLLLANNPNSNTAIEKIENTIPTIEFMKDDLTQKAKELIQDKIDALDWYQMQELVAWLLRAMGYKTKISPIWPDGGKDIVATKDWFGFEDPTIIVEVKHRREAMWWPVVNQLAGVIRAWQKWLFVSTGGFTRQALEMAKNHHHIVMIDLEQLTDLVIEYYESFDLEWQKLIPLSKIYRPM